MAKTNSNLHSAKTGKNDEFYTQLSDVEKECKFYRPHFKNKIVLCNCNDGDHSAFATYFILNFDVLGLKELICTSYNSDGQGVIYRYKGERDGLIIPAIKDCPHEVMQGNGGFNTLEGIELIQEADIIITNPPFSLFREFVALLEQYQKKYLIIGNMNAITYKEIFPLIKENKMWLGPSITSGDRKFNVPEDYPLNAATCGIDENNKKYIRVKGVRWFTNLEHDKRHEPLDLYKKYTLEEYPKYDNYDAINVDKTADIPMDYDSVMGVPITFLDKYCPEQFEIIGFFNNYKPETANIENGQIYGKAVKINSTKSLFRGPVVKGKATYFRILIKKKQ